ncbi:MAG: 2,3-bisphosphoglycerate-independent phosphoglycerate mutase [Chloroflexi bacterium]|nr:2,3-bisphosphoglycerate-independent phosphoglycerate mutase [Chloroflexota bacterium]
MEALFPDSLIVRNQTKIVFLIVDGLGGLAMGGKGGSELQVARTPNLDALAAGSLCGLLEMVAPGVTPGSGPGHLALFGYDPVQRHIGRGVLSALGIDFPLRENDLAARVNFATLDEDGRVIDRRAGRISTERARELCQKVKSAVDLSPVEIFFEAEREHRAALILRGPNLEADLTDTDPQATGVSPRTCRATHPRAEGTAELINRFLQQTRHILSDAAPANMVLLRGFAQYEKYPSLEERYGLRAIAIAKYPMYRGLARLLGMTILEPYRDYADMLERLRSRLAEYDFFFLHIKEADSRGEDGDFEGKVRILEEIDGLTPALQDLRPEVLVVTGDHSTPSALRAHSWHPVPVLLHSPSARADGTPHFDEYHCARGGLGTRPAVELMSLALAHAGRLTKYGA